MPAASRIKRHFTATETGATSSAVYSMSCRQAGGGQREFGEPDFPLGYLKKNWRDSYQSLFDTIRIMR
jgi:hypothetical protein